MEISEIVSCLRTLRNNVIKMNRSSVQAANRLFSWLFGETKWTGKQCIDAYRGILEFYIEDDPTSLELMLSVSGLRDGYRSTIDSVAKRRDKYLAEIMSTSKNTVTDESSLRNREEILIEQIAKKLKESHDANNVPQSLIERCIGVSQKAKSENSPTRETKENADDEYSKEKSEPNSLTRKSRKVINFIQSIININVQLNRSFNKNFYIVILILTVFVYGVYSAANHFEQINEPEPSSAIQPTMPSSAAPVEAILISDEDIMIVPGYVDQIKFAVYPSEADISTISIVSSDPDVLTVARDGMITAYAGQPGEKQRKVTVTIQAENGISKNKSIIVDFTKGTGYKPIADINTYEPEFIVEQKVRLAGTKEWGDMLEDVKVGDKVEFRIEYRNISKDGRRHDNVMIKDILPKNLCYVSGTTMLRNNYHPNGLTTNEDDVITTGINIGDYNAQSNVFVYFTAEVVDNSLQPGSNTLVNWSQCGVGQVTLQDYATVQLYKE